jgi:site-specific recombinase XerD
MLEDLFSVAKVRRRLEQGPMGPYLTQRAAVLHSQGYQSETIRMHLRAAHRFGVWLVEHGLCVADITDATVDSYLKEYRRRHTTPFPHARHLGKILGISQFVSFLAQQGALRSDRRKPVTGSERWLADFDHHLDQVVGNASKTRSDYVRYARRLLTECSAAGEPDWSFFTAEQITDFLRNQTAKLNPSTCGSPVRALRAFIRFLVARGVLPAGLEGAVVRVRAWSQASLPRHISPAELQRILNSFDLTTPVGLRERAIVTVFAQLGIRASELVKLKLDDIDWAEGQVIVRAPKNRYERILPLPQQVGNALVAYVQHSRPCTPARELFVRWRAPLCALSGATAVSKIVRKAFKRAGVNVRRAGVQVLRHTLASQMVRRGATFKEAADILGHRRLSSTTVYAKLDLGSLSRVAMPWPGGAQ